MTLGAFCTIFPFYCPWDLRKSSSWSSVRSIDLCFHKCIRSDKSTQLSILAILLAAFSLLSFFFFFKDSFHGRKLVIIYVWTCWRRCLFRGLSFIPDAFKEAKGLEAHTWSVAFYTIYCFKFWMMTSPMFPTFHPGYDLWIWKMWDVSLLFWCNQLTFFSDSGL